MNLRIKQSLPLILGALPLKSGAAPEMRGTRFPHIVYSGTVIAAEAPLGVLPVTVDLGGAAVVAVTPVVLGAAVAVPEGEDAGLAGVGPGLGDARLLAAFGR